ncbi:unnamed protein product [Cochlearia groenlandica]
MMIMSHSLQIILTCFLLITITTSLSPQGFTVDLIQRRYNSSSPKHFGKDDDSSSSPYVDTIFDTAAYLMKLQIGTPPFEIEAVIDTGSNVVWSQCLPCISCYDQLNPIFDPSKSSTFKENKCHGGEPCPYEIVYADQTYSVGIYGTDTITMQSSSGQPFVLPEATIGCGHNNSGFRPTVSGIIGLDWGSSSLINQMGDRFLGIFSYCFSGKGTSKMNFGGNAIVSGDGTMSTNMFRKGKSDFYYLNLDAVSVGENRVDTLGTPFYSVDGNIFIDSGTTFTYFPESYCNKVKDAITSVVKAERSNFAEDMLCYNADSIDVFPRIAMHFAGGVDLVLENYNIYIDVEEGVYCVTIMCSGPGGEAVFGNRAQNNFLVGYDTSSELVSFKPTNCSALWN